MRSFVIAALLVTVYFLLPLDRSLNGDGIALLLGGTVVVLATLVWQVRAILQARYPILQAIEALAIVIPLFLLTFAALYFELERNNARAFTQPLTRFDALYFTVTVFATVGFGDIAPVTQAARIATTLQMVGDLIVLGVLIKTLAAAAKLTREHRSGSIGAPDEQSSPPVPPPSRLPADDNDVHNQIPTPGPP